MGYLFLIVKSEISIIYYKNEEGNRYGYPIHRIILRKEVLV